MNNGTDWSQWILQKNNEYSANLSKSAAPAASPKKWQHSSFTMDHVNQVMATKNHEDAKK